MLMKVPPITMNSTFWHLSEKSGAEINDPKKQNLVHAVPQTFQLFHSSASLFVRVVPSSDRSHAGWFVARVALCAVIEI